MNGEWRGGGRSGRRPGRLLGGAALAAGLLLGAGGLAGCGTDDEGDGASSGASSGADGAERGDSSAAPDADAAPGGSALPGLPDPAEARQQLEGLTVAEPGSMDGYSRDEFPHWASEDGCTVRQTVLARDGENVQAGEDCQPTSGEWHSAFDDVTLTEVSEVSIDHIVPLANAWRSGADAWDEERRREFANDLTNPQLIAVSARSNSEKGDQSPDQWQPSVESFHCTYGLAWTATKDAYDLTVTEEEREALATMLDTCPS